MSIGYALSDNFIIFYFVFNLFEVQDTKDQNLLSEHFPVLKRRHTNWVQPIFPTDDR